MDPFKFGILMGMILACIAYAAIAAPLVGYALRKSLRKQMRLEIPVKRSLWITGGANLSSIVLLTLWSELGWIRPGSVFFLFALMFGVYAVIVWRALNDSETVSISFGRACRLTVLPIIVLFAGTLVIGLLVTIVASRVGK